MRRKVAVITGTRADYGIFRPVLRELNTRKDLELQLIVTGMHLSEEFGKTVHEIQDDGFPIGAQVDMLLRSDAKGAMAKSLAICLLGVTQALEKLKPDFLLVLGDRGEMLAGAIAGAHLQIVTAHLHGGELSGSIDGSLRHAITRLAHLHFPVTEEAAQCLLRSGEESFRIIQIGAPGLDDAEQGFEVTRDEIESHLGMHLEEKFALVVFHPVVNDPASTSIQVENVLKELLRSGLQCLLFLPNSDAGRSLILEVIKQYESCREVVCISHVPRRIYLGLMAGAAVMIGNSSSGIIEAPFFKLPVINIGSRQQGRTRAANVIDISGEAAEIQQALQRCLSDTVSISDENPYRSGASRIIADTLSNITIEEKLVHKNFNLS